MKPLHSLLMLMLMSGALPSAQAQAPADTAPSSTAPMPAHSPTDVVDRLAKKLSLTDAQKSKILPIIAARQQKIQAVRNDSALAPQQKMGQAQAIMKDSDAQINALLSPEQQQAYAQIEQEMRGQMRAHREQGSPAQ